MSKEQYTSLLLSSSHYNITDYSNDFIIDIQQYIDSLIWGQYIFYYITENQLSFEGEDGLYFSFVFVLNNLIIWGYFSCFI